MLCSCGPWYRPGSNDCGACQHDAQGLGLTESESTSLFLLIITPIDEMTLNPKPKTLSEVVGCILARKFGRSRGLLHKCHKCDTILHSACGAAAEKSCSCSPDHAGALMSYSLNSWNPPFIIPAILPKKILYNCL